MKTIIYKEEEYKVQYWVRYVATDEDGWIWGYEGKPIKTKYRFQKGIWNDDVESIRIRRTGTKIQDWKYSLEEV